MELHSKKILTIDLDRKSFDIKNHSDLNKYIGGVGLGLKLFEIHEERDPLIFAVGPLNGFFPFASKSAIVLADGGTVEDLYFGGSLSVRLKFTGVDAVVILGKTGQETILDVTDAHVDFRSAESDVFSLGLPGKRSVVKFSDEKALLDHQFTAHGNLLENKMRAKNISGMVVTGTETFSPKDFTKYTEMYHSVLNRKSDMLVDESDKPSCANCPMGCEKSRFGELGGNVFVHSLVACQFAERIYSDVNVAFSCLNSLGYDYTHEDLENLPKLIEETIKAIG